MSRSWRRKTPPSRLSADGETAPDSGDRSCSPSRTLPSAQAKTQAGCSAGAGRPSSPGGPRPRRRTMIFLGVSEESVWENRQCQTLTGLMPARPLGPTLSCRAYGWGEAGAFARKPTLDNRQGRLVRGWRPITWLMLARGWIGSHSSLQGLIRSAACSFRLWP